MITITKEINDALWTALSRCTKLISRGRLVESNTIKKEEDNGLQDESNTAPESEHR